LSVSRTSLAVAAGIAFACALARPAAVSAGDLDGLKFRGIGPTLSGGGVAAVAGTDANAFLYYAGAAGGGVFKTTNGGASWTAVFADKPVAAIGAIAISPRNADVVWVGTGEANPRNDVSYGDGVWSSVDGGAHWTHIGLEDTSQISRISIDPRDERDVLVGALGDPFKDSEARGVYRTTDAGKTWQKTLYVGPSSGVSDLVREPRNPRIVLAAVWQYRRSPWLLDSGGPAGGLYRSTDGGTTWTKLTGHGLPSTPTGRIGIAVAPSRPQRVYAVIQSTEGLLWRSDDGGSSWRRMTGDTLVDQRPFYFSRVFVDPLHADHVIALSVRVVESKDGGVTWKRIATKSHWDHHELWWSSDGRRIIDANDGGVTLSNDAGATWARLTDMDVAQIYELGYDTRLPYLVCAGLQDNDTWCGPSNSRNGIGILERDWFDVQGGDGGFVWPDPVDPNLIWGTTIAEVTGQIAIFDTRSQQSVDVSPYPHDSNGTAIDGLPYRFNWVTPLAFSPQNSHVAYAGGNVVFRTSDRGRHWGVISPDLTLNDKTHQIASGGSINLDVSGAEFSDTILDIAPSPVREGVIWVGTDDGLVHVTLDGGAHWKNVTPPGLPPYGRVETVEAGRRDAGSAFVSVDRHMSGDRTPYAFATGDSGATWRSISAGLPQRQFARVIRQDPKNADVLFAGLEQSLWVSLDRGAHWERLRANLPTASVRDLRIPPQATDLIVGTHGRSVWILDDLGPIERLAEARARGAYLFPPRDGYKFWQQPIVEYGDDNSLDDNYFVGDIPKVVSIDFYLSRPARTRPTIEIVDARGHVMRRLAGTHEVDGAQKPVVPNAAGVSRVEWNGTQEPPVKLLSAQKWNRGPDDGADALPGRYTARLHVDGAVLGHDVVLKADPRSPWTITQAAERHDFIAGLLDELSQMDVALNTLERLQKRSADASTRDRARAVAAMLTSHPVNEEDSLLRADGLRERLMTLLIFLESSQQPPFPPQREQAREIASRVRVAMEAYDAFQRDFARR
jgi:photosystem II stability/assembly factor-like uncharacterized protein